MYFLYIDNQFNKIGRVLIKLMGCFLIFLLCSCKIQEHNKKIKPVSFDLDLKFLESLELNIRTYHNYIHYVSNIYNVDEILIKAIIQVESNYNPKVVSKSNAVGLMQLKSSTAGREVYRMKGWKGEPSVRDLKNIAININLGTAYLSILQKRLIGINNPQTKRYALIVSYVNGLGTLLRMFSSDYNIAITKINTFTPEEFCKYIQNYHPSVQARRYLWKINVVYSAIIYKQFFLN
ncbi:transglycosylase SLT domain-containing protein [Blochmannia endosymbiont of Camponotus (Colobopsis) obliquus]|uniref:transglycosylase SLT domain-containing protein n=1 Tax=Blochmannia endosymbiont of Camponotus (Colobopsis) obliquus TaxID=1505597 RepID=UPI00061A8651|nr:transglycosylase SLT domain-containing protein [Blochmannia endosymbiont of Camponotus (Colobopsis) obliquus]AKC60549.1 Endo-type membrane-bound lytic murein transglycosylase A [Blochmannia endosymbiont of Camponotus (Colobopsis) obliquus]